MRRSLLLSIMSALILGLSASAMAAPKAFTGTLTLRLGLGFNSDTPGSGTGTSDGGFGSPATIGSGVFPVQTTFTGSPPFLGIVTALEIAAPGSPGVPGGNGPLNWNGSTGTMPLNASAFLKGFGTTLGSIPLNVVGAGGTQPFQLGTLPGSVVGNLYQLGYFTLTGFFDGSFRTVFASGFDNRTANGFGQLQMVSPTYINFSGFGTIPAAAIVSLNFEPPPPPNDDFDSAILISSLPFTDLGSASEATAAGDDPTTCTNNGSVWYAFTPSVDMVIVADTFQSNYDTVLSVYTGTRGALTQVPGACNDDFQGLQSRVAFTAIAGTTYHFLIGTCCGFGGSGGGNFVFRLEVAPPPQVSFSFFPFEPSIFDTVQFEDGSFDPGSVGIASQEWDFGDGGAATGCCPTHRYVADGEYEVGLTVTTPDGRSASASQTVRVETHDVAILKFSVPNSVRAGQTRTITVGVNSRPYPEEVQVELFRSVPGGGWAQVESLVQSVSVRNRNRTTSFSFSYTFTSEDRSVGKVTFRATATILNERDALPADNEAISPPTKVQ